MVYSVDDLKRKPWLKDESIPKLIQAPVGMIGPEERNSYWWLAKNWLTGEGCIIDAGSFVGASSVAFADGAAAGGRRSFMGGPILHAIDYFSVIDEYVQHSISENFSPIAMGESYLPIYERQTSMYRDMIQVHPGNFLDLRWGGNPIEILFIDLAKSPQLNSHVVAQFFQSLIPQRSLILQQDYFHCWHPHIHITMEYLRDHLDLIDDHVEYQTAIWLLTSPIPRDKLARLAQYDFTADERLALLDRLIAHSSDQIRPMIETAKLWQLCMDKNYAVAGEQLKLIDQTYNLNSGTLWARQVLEVEALMPEKFRRDRTVPKESLSILGYIRKSITPKPIENLSNSKISFDRIIANYPSFHRKPDGSPWFLGISGDTLKAIASYLQPGMRTIETGAGFSSLAFIVKETDHTAICPDDYLEKNIREWCDGQGINHSRFRYTLAKSQDVVPSIEGPLDFVFVDGEHAFPIPQIDFYYLARRLKVGGCMAIDDTNLWTGEILVKHLMMDNDWKLESEHDGKTSIFRLLSPFQDKGLGQQPYVIANSRQLPDDFYSSLRR